MGESGGEVYAPVVFSGDLSVPGSKDRHHVSVTILTEKQSVTLQFEYPVAGRNTWVGQDVKITRRLKFHEVIFRTDGLPQNDLDLTWKMNISLDNTTLAGVVIAKPGPTGIKGEAGYTFENSSANTIDDNYLTRLSSSEYRQ